MTGNSSTFLKTIERSIERDCRAPARGGVTKPSTLLLEQLRQEERAQLCLHLRGHGRRQGRSLRSGGDVPRATVRPQIGLAGLTPGQMRLERREHLRRDGRLEVVREQRYEVLAAHGLT